MNSTNVLRPSAARFILSILFIATGLAISMISLQGCTTSATDPTGQGRLIIRMKDAPAVYDKVNIVVERVEVHKSGSDSTSGWFTVTSIPKTYDLLTLRNGATTVLGDSILSVGDYTQIRLVLGAGSHVVVAGVVHSLKVPSGSESGVKINHNFAVTEAGITEFLLDFDAESSIVVTGNNEYQLKPVIRVVR